MRVQRVTQRALYHKFLRYLITQPFQLSISFVVRCSAVEPFPNEVYKVIITTGYHYSHVPYPCDCETSLIRDFYFSIPQICVKKIWIKDVLPPICI